MTLLLKQLSNERSKRYREKHKEEINQRRREIRQSHAGSMFLDKDFHKIPIILVGDFNVSFATNNLIPLITFLEKEFELRINNDLRRN